MKYLVQIMVILGDIMLIVAAISMICFAFKSGNLLLWGISIILLLLSYNTWKSQDGFIAWTKKGRKAFYKNWDEINRR